MDLSALVLGGILGGLITWFVVARRARLAFSRHEQSWRWQLGQARADGVEFQVVARDLTARCEDLEARAALAEDGAAVLRQELEDQSRLLIESRRSREAIRLQCIQLTGELESLRGQWADAAGSGDRDRELRGLRERLAAASARRDEAVAARQAADADRTRLALQLETVARQLQQSNDLARADRMRYDTARALQATVVPDLKRQADEARALAAKVEAERDDLERRLAAALTRAADLESAGRSETVELQERLAMRTAELGAVRALAERLEPLRRQVEDREALIHSLATERDAATAALINRERELLQRIEALVQQVAGAARTEQALKDREREKAKALRQAASVERERDELGIALKAAEVEAANLRVEIKDRDARFRVLLADRRAIVEASHGEVARLTSLMAAPRERGPGGDDLKRISGIGPSLEKMLKSRGIHSFRQIALWTEEDIERIAADLGAFRSRIKRDQWIEQARREHQEAYGEPLEQ